MPIREYFRRWHCLLLATLLVVLSAIALAFVTLPLRDTDKVQAARSLVAWIVEDESLPGFGERYPDAQWMPKRKHFFVVCDFVPPDVSLSDDPRVQRIKAEEQEEVHKKHQFNDTDYMVVSLTSESTSELVIHFSNVFGGLAGHGYRFEFRRKVWGLRASGKMLWVS